MSGVLLKSTGTVATFSGLALMVIIAVSSCASRSGDPPATNGQIDDLRTRVDELAKNLAEVNSSLAAVQAESKKETVLADGAAKVVSAARDRIAEGDFVAANDLLLGAIRLDPSSPEVFAAAVEFVKKSAEAGRESDADDWASDMYDRIDRLIPFQAIDRIIAARKEFRELGAIFEQPESNSSGQGPFDQVNDELAAIQKSSAPLEIRNLCVQRIRGSLDELAVDTVSKPGPSQPGFWDAWQSAKDRLEKVETDLVAINYAGLHGRLTAWKKSSDERLAQAESARGEKASQVETQLGDLSQNGRKLQSDTQIYFGASLSAAIDDRQVLDRQLERIDLAREWLYNQRVIERIQWLSDEKQKSLIPLAKLRHLMTFNERRLSPYAYQQLRTQWDELFKKCSEEEKLEATKERILKGSLP